MTIEQELLSYQIGYIILYAGFIFTGFIALMHSTRLNKLQKHGKLITRKGTYTFTPHEKVKGEYTK